MIVMSSLITGYFFIIKYPFYFWYYLEACFFVINIFAQAIPALAVFSGVYIVFCLFIPYVFKVGLLCSGLVAQLLEHHPDMPNMWVQSLVWVHTRINQ